MNIYHELHCTLAAIYEPQTKKNGLASVQVIPRTIPFATGLEICFAPMYKTIASGEVGGEGEIVLVK